MGVFSLHPKTYCSSNQEKKINSPEKKKKEREREEKKEMHFLSIKIKGFTIRSQDNCPQILQRTETTH